MNRIAAFIPLAKEQTMYKAITLREFIEIIRENLAEPLYPAYDLIIQKKVDLWLASLNHWYYDDLRKWTWWLNLALSIIPWIVWWKLVDRKRLLPILAVGLLASLAATMLDIIGSEAVLWGYPDRLLPNLPRLFPIDFTVIPVSFMLIYQYFISWKKYFLALVLMSFLFSFAAEPLMVYLGLYEMYLWEYIYSFPIYIAIGLAIRWLVDKALLIQQKALKINKG